MGDGRGGRCTICFGGVVASWASFLLGLRTVPLPSTLPPAWQPNAEHIS